MRDSIIVICISDKLDPRQINIVVKIMEVLKKQAFILNFKVDDAKTTLLLWLAY
jgi:ribosomal protein S8